MGRVTKILLWFVVMMAVGGLLSCGGIQSPTFDSRSGVPLKDSAPGWNSKHPGAESYAKQCAGCHGEQGEGPAGDLIECDACDTREHLAQVIEETMPIANVQDCDAVCSADVANYIFDTFVIPNASQAPVSTVEPTDAVDPISPDPGNVTAGEAITKGSLCSSCHSDDGNGYFSGPHPFDMNNLLYPGATDYKVESVQDLAEYIHHEMPLGFSDSCIDGCARHVAAYLWQFFHSPDPI